MLAHRANWNECDAQNFVEKSSRRLMDLRTMQQVLRWQHASTTRLLMDFSALFLQQYAYVFRGLMRLGVLERDVRDVLQEVFLEVSHALPDYDPQRPMRPWLYAFMVRFAANYRRLARHKETTGDTQPKHAAYGAEDASHTRDLVLRALSALEDHQRTCVVMHDFEGFTAQEIADATETPLGTVYSRVRMGREAFRRAIDELEGAQ
jgi:RNA polymerase sigma-70 factor, ECF subfamily